LQGHYYQRAELCKDTIRLNHINHGHEKYAVLKTGYFRLLPSYMLQKGPSCDSKKLPQANVFTYKRLGIGHYKNGFA